MSSSCGNCDCADSSQCTKKGNSLVIETEKRYDTVAIDAPAAENDCKCGSNCSCTDCKCGK